jgi:hypothetical protein
MLGLPLWQWFDALSRNEKDAIGEFEDLGYGSGKKLLTKTSKCCLNLFLPVDFGSSCGELSAVLEQLSYGNSSVYENLSLVADLPKKLVHNQLRKHV